MRARLWDANGSETRECADGSADGNRPRVDESEGDRLRPRRQCRRAGQPAHGETPSQPGASRVDRLAARADLGRHGRGDSRGRRRSSAIRPRSAAWPSPAWGWTGCRSTARAVGSIPSSVGTTREPVRSTPGGSKRSVLRRPSRSAATRSGRSTRPCGSCGWPSTSRRFSPGPTSGC